jgi:methionine synthase II (cobalamin-independent)
MRTNHHAAQLLDELKRAEQRECELLFVDETSLSLNYPLRSCWMKRGQQKEISAFTGKRDYLHVIGAYKWASAQISHLTVERKNSDTFIAFLEQLTTEYPAQSLILVMDNTSYHHSAKVQAILSLRSPRPI